MAIEVVKYVDLIPRMARDLRGAPSEKYDVKAALVDAGRRFCMVSQAWFEKLTAIDVVAEQQEYTLSTGGYLAQFVRIKELRLLTTSEVTAGDEGSLVDSTRYLLNLPKTLKFRTGCIPGTAVTGGMVITAVLAPQMDAEEIPAWVIDRWGDAIIAHALYSLFLGFDANKASVFLNRYNAVLNEAMVASMDDPSPGQAGENGAGLLIKETFTP